MVKTKSRRKNGRKKSTGETEWNLVDVSRRPLAKKCRTSVTEAKGSGEMSILEKAWKPGKANRLDAEKQQRAKKRAEKKAVARGEYFGPKQTVKDPGSKTEVAVMSDDKGTPDSLLRAEEFLLEFAEPEDFPDPLMRRELYHGGRHYHANVRRDHIDLLYDKGQLSKGAYCAARELLAAWTAAKHVPCGSTNLNRTDNGGVDEVALLDRALAANRKYCAMMRLVDGGPSSTKGLVVMWFCCYARSIRWISKTHGKAQRTVSEMLNGGLEDIARRWLKGRAPQVAGIAAEGLKVPAAQALEI